MEIDSKSKHDKVNAEWVTKSLEFHGQPLQKAWEGEHGIESLSNLGIRNPDYAIYQERQKHFVFQDRAKRLKIHTFIAKKANELFASDTDTECARSNRTSPTAPSDAKDLFVDMPPVNVFLSEKANRIDLVKQLYSQMNVGDIIYGKIQSIQTAGLIVRLLCTHPPNFHIFHDTRARAFLPQSLQVPAVDNKGLGRNYLTNDIVCCEIVEINSLSEKLVIGMKGQHFDRPQALGDIKLGLVQSNQLPEKYKFSVDAVGKSYDAILEHSTGFANPKCIDNLAQLVGLDTNVFYTNMSGLRGKYPSEEYSAELRQSQASNWAFRSVAEGIEHFKEGRHTEAFQCLNKALAIDPRNVEGLVARGALYANNGSLKKAVEDFECALKINSSHSNARKYMGETLVALGRNYEEENRLEEAKKAYQDCLAIIPHHEEAQSSLNFLWNKSGGASAKQIIDMSDLSLPALNIAKMNEPNRCDASVASSGNTNNDSRKEGGSGSKKGKKKKSKSRKRHSSSSSSSESSDSSESSSGDSSSSSESSSSSDSDRSKSKKKKKHSKSSRQRSLSPLSRRMALISGNMDPALVEAGLAGNNSAYNNPQMFASTSSAENMPNDYEMRVSKFLDMTRDEDNYEEKVRKFVEEATKYKKERKVQEEKSKKKDRKKSKKNKKDSKKKKKEKKSKSSKKDKDDLIDGIELREALKLITKLPIFDMNAKKMTEIEMVEKSLNQLKNAEEEKKQLYSESKPDEAEGKWKMILPKEGKKETPITKYAFPNEDDDQDDSLGAPKSQYASTSSHPSASYTSSKYDTMKTQMPPIPTHIPTGPAVLDKFGNFRRAPEPNEGLGLEKPPEPPYHRRSSRSYSRSRSRSRSRSSSRNRRRRRSYSRSRSRSSSNRSGSIDRRRGRRFNNFHNNRRFFNNRGNNRFNNNRGGFYNDFRNNRRWNNNNNNRNNNWRQNNRFRRFSRSRSYSRSVSPRRRGDSEKRQNPPQIEANRPPSPPKLPEESAT